MSSSHDQELETDPTLYSYSPLELLTSLFPDQTAESLSTLLATHGYELEAVIDVLCQETPARPQKQVCRHFLAGGCYRKDCWFSHELESKICKYWLQGFCAQGTHCQFMHGQEVVNRVTARPEAVKEPVAPPPGLGPEAFPSLLPGQDTKARSLDFSSANYQSLSKRVDSSPVRLESSFSSNAYRGPVSRVKTDEASWVATGDTLASSYYKHRSSAIEVALERNRLFQQATQCFLSGHKAAAKKFSLEARRLNDELQVLQAQAGLRIYEERNASKDSGVMDLHGLYPQEALAKLKEGLSRIRGQQTVRVITGTGHHSRLGHSRLETAVREFLSQSRYRWAETSMNDGRGGSFVVYL